MKQRRSQKQKPIVQESKTIKIFLGILVVFACGFILNILGSIFKPFLIALFFSFVLELPIKWMRRIKIPKAVAIIVVLIATFVLFYLLGLVIYSNINVFVNEFPKYQTRFEELYLKILESVKIPEEHASQYYSQIDWSNFLQKLSIPKILSSSVGSFMNFIGNLFLILLFLIFILLGREHLLENVEQAFPGRRAIKFYTVFDNINRGVQKYLFTKAIISLGTGLSATIVLLIFGIDFAWIWGLLAFLLNFIPNIGSIIATLPPILVSIFQFGGLFPAVWVAIFLVGIQMAWGNIIEPAIMGRSLNMSPLVVIISLIFWGFIWGPIGMILAVPISSTIQIVCENIEPLKPISILMGD